MASRIAELLEVPRGKVRVHLHPKASAADAIIEADAHRFEVEWRGEGTAAGILSGLKRFKNPIPGGRSSAIALLGVPFMGEMGRQLCKEANVAWIDLSGNAYIVKPGLRVEVKGSPNRFKRPGRVEGVFSPKSSRISRWLLQNPGKAPTQKELARATAMDEGFTSRIVRTMEDSELLVRDEKGGVKPRDPGALLDAWRDSYEFSKHRIIAGHVATRSGESLLQAMTKSLASSGTEYAATGLGAAWLYVPFASFRLATVYLREPPSPGRLEMLGLREETQAPNTWIVVPNDEGVFHGARKVKGIRCVHPIQVYLDLKGHPERAKEAAVELRQELLNWKKNDR
jgi:hypothetical protein